MECRIEIKQRRLFFLERTIFIRIQIFLFYSDFKFRNRYVYIFTCTFLRVPLSWMNCLETVGKYPTDFTTGMSNIRIVKIIYTRYSEFICWSSYKFHEVVKIRSNQDLWKFTRFEVFIKFVDLAFVADVG